jgi:hypothetical protein
VWGGQFRNLNWSLVMEILIFSLVMVVYVSVLIYDARYRRSEEMFAPAKDMGKRSFKYERNINVVANDLVKMLEVVLHEAEQCLLDMDISSNEELEERIFKIRYSGNQALKIAKQIREADELNPEVHMVPDLKIVNA